MSTDTQYGPKSLNNTAGRLVELTKDADIEEVPRFIWVENGGELKVDMAGNSESENPVVVPITVGGEQPLRVKKVYGTGTTVGKVFGAW